jgi:hypothetical protein
LGDRAGAAELEVVDRGVYHRRDMFHLVLLRVGGNYRFRPGIDRPSYLTVSGLAVVEEGHTITTAFEVCK